MVGLGKTWDVLRPTSLVITSHLSYVKIFLFLQQYQGT